MASPLLKVLHGYHNLCKVKHMQKFLQVFMSQGLDLQMLLKLFLVRVLFTGKVDFMSFKLQNKLPSSNSFSLLRL